MARDRDSAAPGVTFETVLADELKLVAREERESEDDLSGRSRTVPEVFRRAHRSQLFGVAFSGGGIRSATFNLGVLQALAEMNLLRKIHYISSVSGGGYISGWLQAWLHRSAKTHASAEKSLFKVQTRLKSEWTRQKKRQEPQELRFLRRYSNYLTPRVGWFGADMWTVLTIYLRNMVLNLVVLIAALSAILLLPRCIAWLASFWIPAPTHLIIGLGFVLLALSIAAIFSQANLRSLAARTKEDRTEEPFYTKPRNVQLLIVAPLILAAVFLTFVLGYWYPSSSGVAALDLPKHYWALGVAGMGLALLIVARLFPLGRARQSLAGPISLKKTITAPLAILVAAAVGGLCAYGLKRVFEESTLWTVLTWGPPSLVIVVLIVTTLYLGFMGREFGDEVREWWSRLGAWLLIYTLGWIAIFGIAFYSPPLVDWARDAATTTLNLLGAGWVLSTLTGVLAAHSARTGPGKRNRLLTAAASIGPYVFILGMLAALAVGLDALLNNVLHAPHATFSAEPDSLRKSFERHWENVAAVNDWPIWVFLGIAIFVALGMSLRLDINQFSTHLLYRNRLVRCYLGASQRRRHYHAFTGFDPDDDLELSSLTTGERQVGPYPIINAALNLVGGKELAWQQRKAASFVFTPKYCGYEFPELPPGFIHTAQYARSAYPITLGTAVAISGAAASPNMGYHSSPAAMFLMTVFNVRLGWWLGNTRNRQGWTRSSPGQVLFYLVREMLGLTHDAGKFIYLSDGGHFENLAIYELVRRRCRYIVACDAEEDADFKFGGLGNAIEKCRVDLGVEIEIDLGGVRQRDAAGRSSRHCAVGRIKYSRVDAGAPDGTLVYIKSSLTGDEPTDVLRYAAQQPEFPHQRTLDQWFDESQFESYRALGHHVVRKVFAAVDEVERLRTYSTEDLFVGLRERWYPPSPATEKSFAKHAATVMQIFEEMRREPSLGFLSRQVYPEWKTFISSAPDADADAPDLPQTAEDLRKAFYLCNSIIQLMEEVYLDLNLEQEHDHPDNRGWMNFFRHWSWSSTFRTTWTISAATYGARFQSFCERHLDLRIGSVKVDRNIPAARFSVPSHEESGEEATARDLLNPVEQDVIGRFIAAYPDLAAKGEIRLLQIDPQCGIPTWVPPRFTFGFAILLGQRLVSFRVQDHLRKMGLARKALTAFLEEMKDLELALRSLPDDGPEFSTAETQELFRQLFRSARITTCDERKEPSGWARRNDKSPGVRR